VPDRHFQFWPDHAQRHLDAPATNLFYNLEVAARRYPFKPGLIYYGTPIGFTEMHEEAERIAGYLEQRCGVRQGDRVLLFMQNSPQFVIAYYGILRANAVVVPLNAMYLTQEFLRCAKDAGATAAIVSQELYARIEPLLDSGELEHVIVAAYSDYLRESTSLPMPEFVAAPRVGLSRPGVALWGDVLASGARPGALRAGPDDLAVMPYTSGTTGEPKGCMHTHRSTMHTLVATMRWFAMQPESTLLGVAPFFHVTGMQGSMNGPLYIGNTVVLLPRWDRVVAAECVERYRIASWTGVPTMFQDFFMNPNIERYDLSSIRRLSGGGAAMPAAVAQRLLSRGITFCEGYGLSETMGATHINPAHCAKPQCLGIPIYDVDSRIVDPATGDELAAGEVGEIVTHGPQVFLGYWNRPQDSAQAFIEIDGKRFLRTGDLGRVDEDGYFFMVDRLKRMINASGFKVWPTEVESLMYRHPAVREACVIGVSDAHRGETVKAFVVLRPECKGGVEAQAIIDWCRENMAAYKVPRIVEFADELPKSGSGKIQWRELQERERRAEAAHGAGVQRGGETGRSGAADRGGTA
jgi:fatty-acyl-CoA synthase